jgi:hypothetical protein
VLLLLKKDHPGLLFLELAGRALGFGKAFSNCRRGTARWVVATEDDGKYE